jgi:hypothetical protein
MPPAVGPGIPGRSRESRLTPFRRGSSGQAREPAPGGDPGRLQRPPLPRRIPATRDKSSSTRRLPLDLHFTPILAELICACVDLDVPALDLAGSDPVSPGPSGCGHGATGSPKKSCAPTPISAQCADSTVRSGTTRSRLRRPMCAGTASRALTRWQTHWPSARSITRCSTLASPRTAASACRASTSPGAKPAGRWMRSQTSHY